MSTFLMEREGGWGYEVKCVFNPQPQKVLTSSPPPQTFSSPPSPMHTEPPQDALLHKRPGHHGSSLPPSLPPAKLWTTASTPSSGAPTRKRRSTAPRRLDMRRYASHIYLFPGGMQGFRDTVLNRERRERRGGGEETTKSRFNKLTPHSPLRLLAGGFDVAADARRCCC